MEYKTCEDLTLHKNHTWGIDYGDMGSDVFWCEGVESDTTIAR